MIINNLKELNERKILEYEDKVIFILPEEILKYEVNRRYLGYKNIFSKNDIIFKKLKLDKKKITIEEYGYWNNGVWPWANSYEDLTKLVKRIYKEIDKKYFIEKIPIKKFTRFEIMDI